MPALLDRRLVVVTGKGGTGKSTMSAAVALAAARRGRRVLVCEVVAKERVADFFGKPASGPQIRELLPNLYSVHVRPREAMREYALMTLKYETLYKLAFENPAARYFLAAAPSLAEIVMLGKVWWHATQETERGRPRWDLVVLDAPATGHGLTFLTVPETFLRLVSEGPLARDMRSMMSLLADPAKCSICIVTLPEEMPANEAIELDRALRQHHFPAGPLFLNGVFASRFTPQEVAAVTRGGPLLAAAGEAADNHESRAELSRH
jgi:anion-transporting  ArsA/GET3 family ATPase